MSMKVDTYSFLEGKVIISFLGLNDYSSIVVVNNEIQIIVKK